MSLVFIGLGTNLGNKQANLNDAILKLSVEVGFIQSQSSLYNSTSWGYTSENEFLNAVILIETDLLPFDLLNKIKQIEIDLGRTIKTTQFYTDRIIDIDILLYDNLIIDQPTLKIPHPFLLVRDFVYVPMLEIAPDLVHPIVGRKIKEIVYQQM